MTEEMNSQDRTSNQETSISLMRALTRLTIGGLSLGMIAFTENLKKWQATSIEKGSLSTPGVFLDQTSDLKNIDIITIDKKAETSEDRARYAFVGLVFDAQERLLSGIKALDKSTRAINNFAAPLIKPIFRSHFIAPIRYRFDNLVSRGQEEVDSWIERGKSEDVQSRILVETAFQDQLDSGVDYLAENPKIQEIIQGQSLSLAEEAIEEVRERAVSGDNFIEGFFRRLLRRQPRRELPGPPPEVRARAISGRKTIRIV